MPAYVLGPESRGGSLEQALLRWVHVQSGRRGSDHFGDPGLVVVQPWFEEMGKVRRICLRCRRGLAGPKVFTPFHQHLYLVDRGLATHRKHHRGLVVPGQKVQVSISPDWFRLGGDAGMELFLTHPC